MNKIKPNFNNGIVIPEDTIYGNIMELVEHINNEGFKCKLIANEIFFMIEFETKEKAVEAKIKYL